MRAWLLCLLPGLLLFETGAIKIMESEEVEGKRTNCCRKGFERFKAGRAIGHVVLYQNLAGPEGHVQGPRESPGHALDRHQREYYRQAFYNYGKYGNLPEQKRLKPGLLQVQLQLPASGTVLAQGPHGERHVIHTLPEHYLGRPGDPVHKNFDHTYGQKTQRRPPVPVTEKRHSFRDNPYQYPAEELSKALAHKLYHPKFVQLYREVVEEYFREKFGITDLSRLKSENHPIRPSVEYYQYSEPDPLYHSDGILTTVTSPNIVTPASLFHSTIDEGAYSGEHKHSTDSQTQPNSSLEGHATPNKVIVDTIEPPVTNTYPDSINAQLPHIEGDSKVPYVAATTNTESPLKSTIKVLSSEYTTERTTPLVTETTLIIEVEQAKVTELEAHDKTLTFATDTTPLPSLKSTLIDISSSLQPTLETLKENSTKNYEKLGSFTLEENSKITMNSVLAESSTFKEVAATKSKETKNIDNMISTNISEPLNKIKESEFNSTTAISKDHGLLKIETNEKILEKFDTSLVKPSFSSALQNKNTSDQLGHLVLKLVNNAKEQNRE